MVTCDHKVAGGYECQRDAVFVYVTDICGGWTYRSCADHRMYDAQGFFPKGHPIEPARGVRRTNLRDMAVARHFACERRSRSNCSLPCPWYAPGRRLSRLRRAV